MRCFLCSWSKITAVGCLTPPGLWVPTHCTATATCAGCPSGWRRDTRSRASRAAAAPTPWGTGCCSRRPPTTSSAEVRASWDALRAFPHLRCFAFGFKASLGGSWAQPSFSEPSHCTQVAFCKAWWTAPLEGKPANLRRVTVPCTRLYHGKVACRMLLGFIWTNKLVSAFYLPQKTLVKQGLFLKHRAL